MPKKEKQEKRNAKKKRNTKKGRKTECKERKKKKKERKKKKSQNHSLLRSLSNLYSWEKVENQHIPKYVSCVWNGTTTVLLKGWF